MQVAGLRSSGTGLALLLLVAAGCGRDSDWRNPTVSQAAEGKAEAAYLAPPAVTGAVRAGEALTLRGAAQAGARVRLVTPVGEARFADADASGNWTLDVPVSPRAQLYGLSMAVADRTVQSEGYLAVLPGGLVVRLRAGAGALPLTGSGPGLRILAIDFDRDGGALVSGQATPGASLVLRIDGVESQGMADPDGRFSIAASQPLAPQSHQIVVGGDGEAVMSVDASRAQPLGADPVRATRSAAGWRIDWVTPGGGVQTTLIPAA
jgi:hypothetical protein